ncbi:pilus assembly protein PilM [Microbacterium sp. NPDC089318]
MSKTSVGVEITEESVRAVELTAGRAPRVLAFGEVALPPDAAKDSEIIDEGAVAVALRQLWTGAGIKGRSVTLGIASRRVLVREYSTAAMPPDVLRKALPFQVQDMLPVPVAQAVLDYYPTSEQDGQLHGLLVAAVADTVEQLISAFTRTKLRVQAVDLTAFGLARAGRVVAPSGTVAVVHLGDHTTQVVIMRDGIPDFVRILPGDLETAAVRRRSMGTADDALAAAPVLELAGSMLGTAGVLPRGALRGDVGGRPVADLVARLRSTLAFYLNRPGAAPIDQVLLTGAGAVIDGVHDGMQEPGGAPVRLIALPDITAMRDAQPAGDLALNLVSTAGLALGKDS